MQLYGLYDSKELVAYLYMGFTTPCLYQRTSTAGSFGTDEDKSQGRAVAPPPTAITCLVGPEIKNISLIKFKISKLNNID